MLSDHPDQHSPQAVDSVSGDIGFDDGDSAMGIEGGEMKDRLLQFADWIPDWVGIVGLILCASFFVIAVLGGIAQMFCCGGCE